MKRVQNFAHKESLWQPGDHILVAVSGGPDSMALLFLLTRIAKKSGFTLAVAHVNYQLRGEASNQEMFLVQTTCADLDIPCYTLLYTGNKKDEASLRDVRYTFFTKTAARERCTYIALGHHASDQAETLLLRLLRGSGKTGLSAMRPKDGLLIRPLLATQKADLLALAQENSIPFFLDESNTSPEYLRNRVRHELLPLMATYNPNIVELLCTTARHLSEAELPLEMPQIKLLLPSLAVLPTGYALTPAEWQAFPRVWQTALLRALFTIRGLYPPTQGLLTTLLTVLQNPQKNGFTKEFSRLKITQKNGTLHLYFNEPLL